MPSKKKKYNARFPAGRIKKIMQSDEEIGKVAQAVPVIISRTLELFVESLLAKTLKITNTRNAKTLSTSHLKQCIMAEQRFDFLRELVKNVPDISLAEEAATIYNDDDVVQSSPEQDSYSDAASEYNKCSNIIDISQLAASSSTAMQIDIPLDMRKNGRTNNDSETVIAVATNNNNSNESTRCTRSMKYNEQQQIQRSQRESNDVERLQQQRLNKSSTLKTSSVIMHTNPVKLLRTESIPDANKISGGSCTIAKRPRQHKIASTCTSESISSTSTIAAVTAPILNFDFSSKPLVKIDYSTSVDACIGSYADDVGKSNIAHSAPASAAAQSVFDFSQSSTSNISINIDLSSINMNDTNIKPAAATITSFNNKPKAAIDSKLINTSRPNISIIPSAITATSTLSSKKDNTLLELDEDYDNI